MNRLRCQKYNMVTINLFFCLIITVLGFSQNKGTNDSLYRVASQIVAEVKEIDKMNLTKETRLIFYLDRYEKKTRVTCSMQNSVVRKLVYDSYDEGLKANGKEIYYFDRTGKLFCHENKSTGLLSYDIFCSPFFIIYDDKNANNNSVFSKQESQSILIETKFIIDYYLLSFPEAKYTTFNIKADKFFLRTKTECDLLTLPDNKSSKIKKLPKATSLCYIDKSGVLFTDNNKTWIGIRLRSKMVKWDGYGVIHL